MAPALLGMLGLRWDSQSCQHFFSGTSCVTESLTHPPWAGCFLSTQDLGALGVAT